MLSVVADRYCVSRIISYLNIPRHPLTILISEGLRLLLKFPVAQKMETGMEYRRARIVWRLVMV